MGTVRRITRLLLSAAAVLAGAAMALGQGAEPAGAPAEAPRSVLLAAIEGPIGPAVERHLERVLERASQPGVEAVVLRLNTPGGLVDTTREIITAILAAPVPVIGWVAPPGAHAASAGTYILYATHLAAMAPGTNIGAATPVMIGGVPGLPGPEDEGDRARRGRDGGADEAADDGGDSGRGAGERAREAPPPMLRGTDAMTAKVTNDAVAFIRSLAEMHGRNAEWAEKAVREAASIGASEALELGVIEVVATTVEELLAEADGRVVKLRGEERRLATKGAVVVEIEPDAITRLLATITNPNVAFILMLIGIYGIIFEFLNPGSVLPGVVGAIALILALFALNQLPLDYAGLALVILAIALMVAEALTPSFGVLGLGGIIAFVLGATMLFNTDLPQYRLSPWMIAGMTAFSAAFLILVLGYAWRSYRQAPVSGVHRLLGARAEVIEWADGQGYVWLEGERWAARGPRDLAPGETVRVTAVDGLTVTVAPAAESARDAPNPEPAE